MKNELASELSTKKITILSLSAERSRTEGILNHRELSVRAMFMLTWPRSLNFAYHFSLMEKSLNCEFLGSVT